MTDRQKELEQIPEQALTLFLQAAGTDEKDMKAGIKHLQGLPHIHLETDVHHRRRLDGFMYTSCMSAALNTLTVEGILTGTFEFFGHVTDPKKKTALFYFNGQGLKDKGLTDNLRYIRTLVQTEGGVCVQSYSVKTTQGTND